MAEAVAPGFSPRPALNLRDRGGKIINDLVYTNFFIGGAACGAQDRDNIDRNLAKTMTDQGLNNVLLQYSRHANITSTFRPSTPLPGDPPAEISQPQVERLVRQLNTNGKLNGSVFNFMLPRGAVLTIDDGSSPSGNGIVAFDQSWKNVVATFYHELVEARTDADVEEGRVAWVNNEVPSEEIGDIPMTLSGLNLGKVMKKVPLTDGSGTVPIQLMWSNAVSGPEGPIPAPH
jgi:hypothetical protein